MAQERVAKKTTRKRTTAKKSAAKRAPHTTTKKTAGLETKNVIDQTHATDTKEVLALIFGVLGLLAFYVPLIGLILGILAVAFSQSRMRERSTDMLTIAHLLGWLAIILNLIVLFLSLTVFTGMFGILGHHMMTF